MSLYVETVATQCPLCRWESSEVPVQDEVNGEWFAFKVAAEEYREHHHVAHPLPAPIVVKRSEPRKALRRLTSFTCCDDRGHRVPEARTR